MSERPQTFRAKIIYSLPKSYYEAVGEMMTVWSYIEWEAHEIMYTVLGLNPKIGRIAVAEPRAADQLRRVQQVLSVKAIEYDDSSLKRLIKRAEVLKDRRDAFAHGVWMDHPDSALPVLRNVRGQNPDTKIPQKLWPGAEPWTPYYMSFLVGAFRRYAKEINEFRGHLRGVLPPSPDTPQPRFRVVNTLASASDLTLRPPLPPSDE